MFRATLTLLSCSPNFPRASITPTIYRRTLSMNQFFTIQKDMQSVVIYIFLAKRSSSQKLLGRKKWQKLATYVNWFYFYVIYFVLFCFLGIILYRSFHLLLLVSKYVLRHPPLFHIVNSKLWPAPSWLDSSVGRALHRYRRGHGFEYCSGLNFPDLISQLLKFFV